MPTITEIRQKYPQYGDLSDDQLAGALHQKFYSDVPIEEFRAKIGLTSIPRLGAAMQALPDAQPQGGSFLDPLIGQGVMMGFGDEVKAGVRGAARSIFGNNPGKSLSDLYSEELAGTRADLGEFQQRHPVLSPTLEIGGAIATVPLIPGGAAARGAGILSRVGRGAVAGAGQGAVYGAGTAEGGLQDRALGAAQGAGLGAVGGAAAPLVVRGAQGVGRAARDYVGKPIIDLKRGYYAPGEQAKRGIGEALQKDAAIQQPRLMPTDEAVALRHGTPVMNIDRGGEATRRLAQKAGNISPEAGAILKTAVDDRFATQAGRTEGTLRQIVGGMGPVATKEALETQARVANRGAYAGAYRQGDRPIWSKELARLTTSGAIRKAMGEAATRGNDRAVAEGFGGFNPGVSVDPSGILSFKRNSLGAPTYPNIQYWDYVQRELKDAARAAAKTGRNEEAGALEGLHSSLNRELDKRVPEFANARQGAAQFFGAQDALEAGQKFGKGGTALTMDEARAAHKKLSAPEQQLFAEGWTNSTIERVNRASDRRNVINDLFLNPKSREQVQLVLGPARAKEFEAFLHAERMVNEARGATQGFSTTARQMGELGLAGGITGSTTGLGTWYGTGDWRKGAAVGIASALLKRSSTHVNAQVARRVAEMLVSDDPAVLQQGLRMVAGNDAWMQALRHLDRPAVAAGAPLRITLGGPVEREERERLGAPLR